MSLLLVDIKNEDNPEQMPFSAELEYGLLGWILTDNSLLDHLIFLSPEHFFTQEHGRLYAEMIEMRAQGDLITPFSVSKGDNTVNGVTGYLIKAMSFSVSVIRPLEEARLLVELAERRAVISACQKQIQSIRAGDKTASEHIAELADELKRAAQVGGNNKFMTDRQVTNKIISKLNNPQKPYSTGIAGLDDCMDGGLYPEMNYLFGGRKKMGKTTLAGSISCNLNMDSVKHLYIAGEMGIEQIQQRNLSRLTNTFSNCFRTDYGRTEEFQNKIRAQVDASTNSTIYLNAPGITFDDLRRSVSQAISTYNIKGFILDSLQLVGGKDGRKSQAEHQDEVSQWCAEYGRQHSLFSIVTAQMNQTGNIRGGEGARMACDMGFEIHAPEDDPSRSVRWLEMLETRYTSWKDLGTPDAPGLHMDTHGPFFHQPPHLDQNKTQPMNFL